jgi:DNA repair protein RadC
MAIQLIVGQGVTHNRIFLRKCARWSRVSNAAALICAYNHPSGAPQPSQEDRALTRRLVDAGKLLGIAVLDHVIIGDGTEAYFSFADEGLL